MSRALSDLHSPGLRWLDPSAQGEAMGAEDLERERAAVGLIAGRRIEAAWVSADGRTVRYALEVER